MNDKELQQAFIQFLTLKSGAKSEKELEQYIKSLGEDGLKKAYEEFGKLMQQKAQKAQHGAKLNYINKLKNKCPEGYTLVYHKKGGKVGCGCMKKEEGGDLKKKKINPNDTIHVNGGVRDLTSKESPERPTKEVGKTGYRKLSKEEYRKLPLKDKQRVDEKDVARGRQVFKCGNKIKVNCGGSKMKLEKGAKVNKAGIGCMLGKKYQVGGLLEILKQKNK